MANSVSYKTPYGTWALIDNGMAYIFDPQKINIQSLNIYVKPTNANGGKLSKKGCVWSLPPEGWKSLAEYPAPMDEQKVKSIGLKTLEKLQDLHKRSLSVGDFSPHLIYVSTDLNDAVLYPTPWLESQVKVAPGSTQSMSFVAPDLERPVGNADSLLSDIYSFGCLLWFLLSGMDRKTNPILPSEFDSSLAQWDTIIDGCTRNNPIRRFKSLEQIQSVLSQIKIQDVSNILEKSYNTTSPSTSTVRTKFESNKQTNTLSTTAQTIQTNITPNNKPQGKKLSRRTLLLGGIGLVGAGVLYGAIHGLNISVPGISTPYRRGFGNTILSYQNRNYEGAKWVKKHKLPVDDSYDNFVSGWDDNNYWICNDDNIYKYSNGSYISKITDLPKCLSLFPVSNDLVYAFTDGGWNYLFKLYAIDSNGAERFEFDYIDRTQQTNTMYQVNAGIIRIHPTYKHVLCFDSNTRKTSFITSATENYFIHDIDNNAEKNSVACIKDIHSISPGLAYGIESDTLVKYHNNIWQRVQEFPFYMKRFFLDIHGNTINGIVGIGSDKGQVFRISSKGNHEIQINNTASESTMDLVQIWGVDINKFWVMDTSGSIWQWENNNWRHVIHSIIDSSHGKTTSFMDSWISPTGTAYGITREYLYQLEWN